jgi:Kdo2-lipid IVA lauroyltransferase/acyltransferase
MLVRLGNAYRRGLAVLLNVIGPRATYAVLAVLARRLYRLLDPLRLRSEAQCRAALGESRPADEIRRIAEGAFVHRAWNLADLMLAKRRIRRDTLDRYGGLIPEPYLGQLLAVQLQRRPVILITAYYGPFDLLPLFLGFNGIRAGVLYRPHANPGFDAYRRSVRAASGCELIPTSQALVRLPAILEAGGTVALLSDHAAGRGVPVTFLGLPSVASRSVGLLAERFRAVVTIAGIRRQKEPFRFQVVVTDLFDPSAWSGADDAVEFITKRYVAALEQLVLGDPTQYLWAHARWGTELADLPTSGANVVPP